MSKSEDDTFRTLCKASVHEICEIYDKWIHEFGTDEYILSERIQRRGWTIEEGKMIIKHYDLPRIDNEN